MTDSDLWQICAVVGVFSGKNAEQAITDADAVSRAYNQRVLRGWFVDPPCPECGSTGSCAVDCSSWEDDDA